MVCPFLLDVDVSQITGPLAQFTAKKADRIQTLELLETINAASSRPIEPARLRQLFGLLWPNLEERLGAIPPTATSKPKARDREDVLEELVAIVRSLDQRVTELCGARVRRGGVGVGVGVAPSYPPEVVVGDSNIPVSLTVTNASTGARTTLTLSKIRHTPSCGTDSTPCPAGQEDKDVFLVKGVAAMNNAMGRSGTACEGMTFTIGPPNPTTGEIEFTPDNGPIVLPAPGTPSDTCTIDFLVDVLKLPTKNAGRGPDMQTAQLGRATGTAILYGVSGTGTGSGLTTVRVRTPTTPR